MKTVITYDKLDEKDDLRSLIADHDEEEECLSRTEIGEDEERCAHRPKESRWKKNVKRVKKVRWLIDMVLILVNISLSILLLQAFRQERSTSSMQVGSNYMGTGPDCKSSLHDLCAIV